MQQEISSAFIRTFQLNPEELVTLHGTSREAPITEEYFSVLSRVQVKTKNLIKFFKPSYNNKHNFNFRKSIVIVEF